MDSYRSGHAFTFALHRWDRFHYNSGPNLVTYADGILAWVDTNCSRMVKLLGLKTTQEWSFLSEAISTIDATAVSSLMIVALDSGVCHVWALRTRDKLCLRLPFKSHIGRYFAVLGESLAVVYHQSGDPPRFEVLTWTLQEGTISSFFVEGASLASDTRSLMLDGKGKTLLFCERSDRSPSFGPMTFYYTRTHLAGDVLVQGAIEIPDPKHRYDFCSVAGPREANGRAVLWKPGMNARRVRRNFELMLVSYNFQEDRLKVRTHVLSGLRMNIDTPANLFHWKNTTYYLDHDVKRRNLRVIDHQNSTCSEAKVILPSVLQSLIYISRKKDICSATRHSSSHFLNWASVCGASMRMFK